MAEKKEGKKKSNWSQTALETIADGLGVDINITAKTSPRDIWNSRKRVVYRLTLPNQHKVDFYNFKENIWDDVNQYLITSQAVGNHIDFDKWFEQWRFNFPSLTLRPHSKSDIKTNYPIRTKSSNTENGVEVDELPEYILYKAPNINSSYMTIEYFPEGTGNLELSFICSGTVSSIISSIVSYHIQPESQIESFNNESYPTIVGHPLITIYFSGKERILKRKDLTRVQISFRLMRKIESLEDAYLGESVLTQEEVDNWSTKIKNTFNDYTFKRGPSIVSYKEHLLGYSFWGYFVDAEEGRRLFSTVLSLQNHQLKPELLRLKQTPFAQNTPIKKTKKILGKDRVVHYSPVEESVYFTHATLKLPHSKQAIMLTKKRF